VIDLKRLREDPGYRAGIERKRVSPGLLQEVERADSIRRGLLDDVERLRARQNAASKEIGKAAPEDRARLIAAAADLKDDLAGLEPALAVAEETLRDLALQVPNPADASVPDGGEDDGEVLRLVGEPPTVPPRLDHEAFGEAMGWVDSERGAEASGSRFAYLLGEAVLLELALVQWTLGRLVAHGFTPVTPPVLVRERTMEEAGFFPTDRAQVYAVPEDALFLTGTSEIALSALRRDHIFPSTDDLPARFAGLSTNFRREAGTYGKDTRGIFRVHQFDKVEMFAYAEPSRSEEEHEALLAIEEGLLSDLGLPYRVVNIAAGDLGAAAAKKFDLEAWLPSEGRYRELTSCSNYAEFSARRLGARVRGPRGTELVHTLNGTACAVSRTLVFLFEHYQQPDGSFVVPEVLRPFVGAELVAPAGAREGSS
jgi:seryl-tRNA synthetase